MPDHSPHYELPENYADIAASRTANDNANKLEKAITDLLDRHFGKIREHLAAYLPDAVFLEVIGARPVPEIEDRDYPDVLKELVTKAGFDKDTTDLLPHLYVLVDAAATYANHLKTVPPAEAARGALSIIDAGVVRPTQPQKKSPERMAFETAISQFATDIGRNVPMLDREMNEAVRGFEKAIHVGLPPLGG